MEKLKAEINSFIEERSLGLLGELRREDTRYDGLVSEGKRLTNKLKEKLSGEDWMVLKELLRDLYLQMEIERGYLYVRGLRDYQEMDKYLKQDFLDVYFEDDAAENDF